MRALPQPLALGSQQCAQNPPRIARLVPLRRSSRCALRSPRCASLRALFARQCDSTLSLLHAGAMMRRCSAARWNPGALRFLDATLLCAILWTTLCAVPAEAQQRAGQAATTNKTESVVSKQTQGRFETRTGGANVLIVFFASLLYPAFAPTLRDSALLLFLSLPIRHSPLHSLALLPSSRDSRDGSHSDQ